MIDYLLDSWVSGINHTNKLMHLPYNVIKDDKGNLTVEIAMAGYFLDDIEVTAKDGILSINATKNDSNLEYVYKGISSKSFKSNFIIPSMYTIGDVVLENGILKIHFIKYQKDVQKIDIKEPSTKQSTQPSV